MSVRSSLSCLLAALTLAAFTSAARAEVAAPAAAPPAEAAPASTAYPASGAPPAADDAPPGVAPLAPPAPAPVAAEPFSPLVAAPIVEPIVEEPKRVPLAKRWWFWAGLGTAAVGVVLAAIFLGPRQPYTGNAMPGQESVF